MKKEQFIFYVDYKLHLVFAGKDVNSQNKLHKWHGPKSNGQIEIVIKQLV